MGKWLDALKRMYPAKPTVVDLSPGGMTLVPHMGSPEFDLLIERMRKGREGIKPPTDTATDGWTWDAWSKEMAALAFPGWSPCRFAHRSSPLVGNDRARFVFGITSGAFGIWRQPFNVCSLDDEGQHQQLSATLACLTHLPTGMGLGIFKHVDAAAIAADTMIRTCPQMASVTYDSTPGSPWSALIERSVTAWKAIGIEPSFDSHAHDPSTGSGPHFIMGLADNLEDGKPERLS